MISRATSDVEHPTALVFHSQSDQHIAGLHGHPAGDALRSTQVSPGCYRAYPVMLGTVRLLGGRMMSATLSAGGAGVEQFDPRGSIWNRSDQDLRTGGFEQDALANAVAIMTAPSVWHGRAAPCFLCWREFPRFLCCCCWPSAVGNWTPAL